MKWIFVTSPKNAEVCFKYRVYGVSEDKYGYTALNHVKKGDLVFFYVTRCRVFIGPWRVVDTPRIRPEHPAVREWRVHSKERAGYSVIVELDRCDSVVLTLGDTVLRELLFVTNKKGLDSGDVRGGWTDHFQFSIISIRDEDYETLVRFGKPTCETCAELHVKADYVKLANKLVECDLERICNVICG